MKFLLTIQYKGTNFAGWQSQLNKRTIQNEIETVLATLFGEKIKLYGSGRTDAGVHALAQTAHFEIAGHLLERFFIKNKMNKEKLILAINSNLPEDIKVLKIKKVAPNFHARYNIKEKIYLYKMETKESKLSPLFYSLVGICKENLDIEKMKEGAKYLIGEHDFTSFCSSKTYVKNFTRIINYIKIKKRNDNIITFEISGNGFLYNMVRIIIGTLVDVGTSKIEPEQIKKILEAKSRSCAGKTAKPEGLYLKKVKY